MLITITSSLVHIGLPLQLLPHNNTGEHYLMEDLMEASGIFTRVELPGVEH